MQRDLGLSTGGAALHTQNTAMVASAVSAVVGRMARGSVDVIVARITWVGGGAAGSSAPDPMRAPHQPIGQDPENAVAYAVHLPPAHP